MYVYLKKGEKTSKKRPCFDFVLIKKGYYLTVRCGHVNVNSFSRKNDAFYLVENFLRGTSNRQVWSHIEKKVNKNADWVLELYHEYYNYQCYKRLLQKPLRSRLVLYKNLFHRDAINLLVVIFKDLRILNRSYIDNKMG